MAHIDIGGFGVLSLKNGRFDRGSAIGLMHKDHRNKKQALPEGILSE